MNYVSERTQREQWFSGVLDRYTPAERLAADVAITHHCTCEPALGCSGQCSVAQLWNDERVLAYLLFWRKRVIIERLARNILNEVLASAD